MQEAVSQTLRLRVEKVMKHLAQNKMKPYFLESADEVPKLLDQLIQDGQSVGFGGSVTLYETGVIEYLRGRNLRLIDRDAPGFSRDQAEDCMRACFHADWFLASSNAVTEQGELFNVDGNGNRVAAMIYGPKQVALVVGVNKIVADLEEARRRVEKIAAPANTIRLHCDTPCAKLGECVHCHTDARICCNYVTMAQQRVSDRIHVILVNESLGF